MTKAKKIVDLEQGKDMTRAAEDVHNDLSINTHILIAYLYKKWHLTMILQYSICISILWMQNKRPIKNDAEK